MQIEDIVITDGFGQVRKIGKRIGEEFHTVRNFTEHLYRMHDSWCIDAEVIMREDIQVYILQDLEDSTEYYATRETFLQDGKRIQWAGHGEQISLPRSYWQQFTVNGVVN